MCGGHKIILSLIENAYYSYLCDQSKYILFSGPVGRGPAVARPFTPGEGTVYYSGFVPPYPRVGGDYEGVGDG